MKKTILAILMVLPTLAMASGAAHLDKADYNLHNKESVFKEKSIANKIGGGGQTKGSTAGGKEKVRE